VQVNLLRRHRGKEGPQNSPPLDTSDMPADIHAPLFRTPQRPQAGAAIERSTAGLPKQESASKIEDTLCVTGKIIRACTVCVLINHWTLRRAWTFSRATVSVVGIADWTVWPHLNTRW